jgi:uncharacterized membrane protein YraQ (UPF0718 family)
MLSAPAVNPVVLVATSVAFPTRPEMVLARALASFATAVVVGWLWHRAEPARAVPTEAHEHGGRSRWHQARVRAMRTLDRSIAMLALGAAASATMNVAVPQTWLRGAGTHLVTGVLTLALLAVVLAVCSEADAFVASSFAQFSSTAQLAFMVVGPAVDVKLAAMYAGTFGRRFAIRFVPLVLAVAVTVTAIVSWIVL